MEAYAEVMDDILEAMENFKEAMEKVKEMVEDFKNIVETYKNYAEDLIEITDKVKDTAEDLVEIPQAFKGQKLLKFYVSLGSSEKSKVYKSETAPKCGSCFYYYPISIYIYCTKCYGLFFLNAAKT
ncbi:MAG: hypothetical protein KA275_00605 [Chitinophagaceae bacterium]|nr:hypothetical protein [Chitinophagaceae bacterium]